MGTQQMMLMILGIIVVGIAIAVGIMLFTSTTASSNKDAIINDLMNIGQYAYRFKLKPEPLGGGGRRYRLSGEAAYGQAPPETATGLQGPSGRVYLPRTRSLPLYQP